MNDFQQYRVNSRVVAVLEQPGQGMPSSGAQDFSTNPLLLLQFPPQMRCDLFILLQHLQSFHTTAGSALMQSGGKQALQPTQPVLTFNHTFIHESYTNLIEFRKKGSPDLYSMWCASPNWQIYLEDPEAKSIIYYSTFMRFNLNAKSQLSELAMGLHRNTLIWCTFFQFICQ